jgi:LAO/AO transport system kinase
MILINKADGDNIEKAKQAAQQYNQAIHLFPANGNGWITTVNICSAINNSGIDTVWQTISQYQQEQNHFIMHNRIQQQLMAFREYLQKSMLQFIFSSEKINEQIAIAEKNIVQQKSFSHKEAQQILSIVYNKLK